MATNPPPGPGRMGPVRKRDQVHSHQNKRWTKRNTKTGKFVDQKHDLKPFKGVRKKHF